MTLSLLLLLLQIPAGDAARWLDQARARQKAGDYAGMEQAARNAIAACAPADDPRCRGQALNLEGASFYYRGAYREALRRYIPALQELRRAGDSEQQVYLLNNIGSIHFVQGRYEEALRAYRQASALVDAHPSASWRAEALQTTQANLAALLQRLGRYDSALQYYRSIAAASTALSPDERAQWLTNLGGLLRRLGDPYKARAHYQAALALYRPGADLDARLGTLRNLAIVEALDLDLLPAAESRFRTILAEAARAADARETLHATLYLAETLWRRQEREEAEQLWNRAAAAAARLDAPEERWKALYGLARAARARGAVPGAVQRLEAAVEIIEGLRSGLRDSGLRGDYLGDKRDVYDERIEIELARAPVDGAALARWLERSRERRLQDSSAPGAAALPPGASLLLFWIRGSQAARIHYDGHKWSVQSLRLPSRAADVFESDLASWSDPRQTAWRQASARWGRALLEGVPPGRLVIVPDGFLARLPFEALIVSGRLAVEQFTISYAPSLRFAARSARRRTLAPWELQAVGAGAVEGGDWPIPGDANLGALPGARSELHALRRALPGRVDLHTGRAATPATLLSAFRTARVVHLATHAVADLEDPRRSRLLLAKEPGGRSYLFLPDFAGLQFPQLELATLSACETESGRLVAAEGVSSFGRALLASGAESVVSSLWRVDDRATARFMDAFFRSLAAGRPRAAALREARLHLLRQGGDWSHPAAWAGFVLLGEGDAPLGSVLSWPLLLSVAGVALAVAGALWLRFRQ